MLLNPTGGLVGGDCLLTEISQGSDTRVCLTTPSATRVYRTLDQPAAQETRIQVGEGASLEYLPDHVIPYRDSKLRQSLQVEIGRGGRAIVWDALAAGRVSCGERWNFCDVDSRLEIFQRGVPVYLNRMRIRPGELDPQGLGFAEGYNYLATLAIVADGFDGWNETITAMNTQLGNIPEVCAGASGLASGGCVVRLLARSAADLVFAQKELWGRARRIVFGSPAIDLRKY